MLCKKPNYPPLPDFDFSAALAIVYRHFGGPSLASAPRPLQTLASNGHVAVGLFFVLSGFVLAYNHVGTADTIRKDKRKFWTARFARIYPAYFAAFVLAAPFFVTAISQSHSAAGTTMRALAGGGLVLTLLQSWIPAAANYWNSPAWSLSVEAFFYFTFPLLLPNLANLKTRTCFLAGFALWIAAITPSLVIVSVPAWPGVHASSSGMDFWIQAAQCFPLFRLPEFLIGMLAGICFSRRNSPRFNNGAFLAFGSALAIFIAMAVLPRSTDRISGNGFLAPLFVMLIWTLARSGGPIGAVLGWRPIVFLGEISFSIYILQEPFRRWVQAIGNRDPQTFFYAYVLGLIALSAACFLFIENTGGRLIKSVLRHRNAPRSFPAGLVAEGS